MISVEERRTMQVTGRMRGTTELYLQLYTSILQSMVLESYAVFLDFIQLPRQTMAPFTL